MNVIGLKIIIVHWTFELQSEHMVAVSEFHSNK